MRIAVCDDNAKFLQELSRLLNVYVEENSSNVEYKTFTNPLELVTQIEQGFHYDVIFLDICMPGMNGIQCAKDIRMYDNFVKIVFLTSSTEYGIESYRVKAYDYLLKPLEKEKLFSVLSQIEKEKQKKEQNIFVLKSKIGITKISLSNLEYCEVVNRRVIFHILNEEEYECGLRMNEVEEKLMPLGCFVRPHRSFLINMNFIKTLNAHSIVMESGAQIPMPREKYAGIKSRYMEYIFQKSDTVLLGE